MIHPHIFCNCGDAQDFNCPVINGYCTCTKEWSCGYCRENYPDYFPFLCQKRNMIFRLRKMKDESVEENGLQDSQNAANQQDEERDTIEK